MPSLDYKKITRAHTSLISVAESIVKSASRLQCVNKIVLGVIKSIKSPPASKSIKISEIPVGVKVRARGPKSVQELYIYTNDRKLTIETIVRAFES